MQFLAKFIKNTQDDIQHLTFQLDMMGLEKSQLADHKMDGEKRDLMYTVDREVCRAGTALIQRDTERAWCRQRRSLLNALITIGDNRIMRLVVNGPPASETEYVSTGFKPTSKVNLEMRASVFKEHNHTLMPMMKVIQIQKNEDKKKKKQLR
ncbi:hypothetical protein ACJ72_07718 [Emergomyces africanus]|uniref:Uncharacterized protein n=1 Tax=Emergomyces africanus TaxID=1955775 RepID=A0A1B7NMS2_9EURO|nr:hypothetical protein ACJ72_07718 [Emergomyces africanus]